MVVDVKDKRCQNVGLGTSKTVKGTFWPWPKLFSRQKSLKSFRLFPSRLEELEGDADLARLLVLILDHVCVP